MKEFLNFCVRANGGKYEWWRAAYTGANCTRRAETFHVTISFTTQGQRSNVKGEGEGQRSRSKVKVKGQRSRSHMLSFIWLRESTKTRRRV